MKTPLIIYWFRRGLRLHDNRALFEALQNGCPVLPLFIFDTDILDKLPDKRDKRVGFIYHAISKLQDELIKMGSSLLVLYGKPLDIFQQLQQQYAISAVYANHDYEPEAIKRDSAIADLLKNHNIRFETYKDQVIFEKAEVLKPDGNPYTVFTPYSKRWKQQLTEETVKSFPSQDYLMHLYKTNPFHFPALTAIGFVDAGMRELNATGYMHNRVRMIVASFLTKHLLIDWRWGEAYFAEKLLDYELSSNNGNWQWSAGCGCDAAPYFRIFNPAEQTKKFDPKHIYINKWVENIHEKDYPEPVVEHQFARERVLQVFKMALNNDKIN